jgi:acyl-CoA synthetase (AMP-forming)/AMP-acid ligase II
MSGFVENLRKKEGISINYKSESYTYRELHYSIYRNYQNIQKSIPQGAVVALITDFNFNAISLFFAFSMNKNIIVPIVSQNLNEINTKLSEATVNKIVEFNKGHLKTKSIKNVQPQHELIKRLVANKKSGLVIFSSGMTGKPKAMLHDLDKLLEVYTRSYLKNINTIVLFGFDHIGGIDTMLSQFAIGGSLTIPDSKNPENVCRLIERYKVNVLPASPTFLNLLVLNESYKKFDLSSLHIIGYGAETMPESLLHRLNEIFPNVKLQQKFGTSETNALRIRSRNDGSLFFKIKDPNVEYKIVNNELLIKSKTQILGYLNTKAGNFTTDGFFKTGDIVELAGDDYLKIIGRCSDIINVGGQKVFPAEVESVLMQHPEVLDCAVYGEKNAITGNVVVADVVLSNNEKDTPSNLRKFCRTKLEPYKIPVKFKTMDSIQFNNRFKKMRK